MLCPGDFLCTTAANEDLYGSGTPEDVLGDGTRLRYPDFWIIQRDPALAEPLFSLYSNVQANHPAFEQYVSDLLFGDVEYQHRGAVIVEPPVAFNVGVRSSDCNLAFGTVAGQSDSSSRTFFNIFGGYQSDASVHTRAAWMASSVRRLDCYSARGKGNAGIAAGRAEFRS